MLIAKKKSLKYTLLFLIGGFAYGAIENLTRGYSHISMFIAGGICFLLIGELNERGSRDLSLLEQMAISAVIITLVEFITGLIVNVWLKLDVWDYSELPFNIRGQVCLPFTFIWFFLSLLAIFLDDYLRYFLMGEEKPRYRVF
jgi:uncharacterized membrane protein